MCLSSCGRVVSVDRGEALVDVDGTERPVSLAPIVLDGRPVAVGDWVLVHTGLAMDVIDEAEARDLAALSREVRGWSDRAEQGDRAEHGDRAEQGDRADQSDQAEPIQEVHR